MTPSFLQSRVYRRRELQQVQRRSDPDITSMRLARQHRRLATFQAPIVENPDCTDQKACSLVRPKNITVSD